MAALSEKVKGFIVERLAVFDTPSEIVAAVKEEFGLDVTRQHVWTFDPTKPTNADRISKKLRTIFEATRARFLNDVGDIAIANKAVRLRRIDRMATQAEASKNIMLAAQLLEQAAKECGNAYTNRHELTGANGRTLVPPTGAPTLTREEKLERLQAAVALARRRKAEQSAA